MNKPPNKLPLLQAKAFSRLLLPSYKGQRLSARLLLGALSQYQKKKKVTGLQYGVPCPGKHYLGVARASMDTELPFRRRKACVYTHTSIHHLQFVRRLSSDRILTNSSPFLFLLIIHNIPKGSEDTHFITD